MKSTFTFEEISKIFAKVVKIDEAAQKQTMFYDAYRAKDKEFETEFAKNGWSFMGGPESLGILFEEKMSLSKAVDAATKKTHKLVKEYFDMFVAEDGCDVAYSDEDYVKDYITSKFAYKIEAVVYRCKNLARRAALRVEEY